MTVSGARRPLDERFHTLQTMTSPLTLLIGGYRCLEAISTTCLDGRVAHAPFSFCLGLSADHKHKTPSS